MLFIFGGQGQGCGAFLFTKKGNAAILSEIRVFLKVDRLICSLPLSNVMLSVAGAYSKISWNSVVALLLPNSD